MKSTKYSILVFLCILISCKFFYWFYTAPNADEAYYWLWGRTPALSYHDHPALQALTQGLFYYLFGKSSIVLRIPVFICLLIDIMVYYKILKKINQQTDPISIILAILSLPLIFLFTTYAWNDYLMISMCLCSTYFWINYFVDIWDSKKGKTIDIMAAFFFLGLAALSKYNSIFISFGIFSLIILNTRLYSIFKDIRFYIGIIECLIIISPIFIWNSQNEYGSFQFTLGQRTLNPFFETGFQNGNLLGFVAGSIFLISPFIILAIIKIVLKKPASTINILSTYSTIYTKLSIHVFLWSSISFLVLSTFSNVLYYWNIPAYLLISPLALLYIREKSEKWIFILLAYSCIINSILIIHFGILPFDKFFGIGQDKDAVYYFGWNQIGSRFEKIISDNPKGIQIFTSYYRSASLLSLGVIQNYSQPKPTQVTGLKLSQLLTLK